MRRDTASLPEACTSGGASGRSALLAAFDAASMRRLRRVALRITRDPAAADDVVQGAFEKAWRHAGAFRREARASTWLHRIVVNEALMWQRREGRRRALLARAAAGAEIDARADGPQPLDALLARERAARLRRALATLAPEDAELVARAALGDAGYAAWARERGLRAGAAKTRAFRARRALRAALEAEQAAQQQPPPSHGPRVSR